MAGSECSLPLKPMSEIDPSLDAARVGKMFVTKVTFEWHNADSHYVNGISVPTPAHWEIKATLKSKLDRYGDNESMSIEVEQGVGAKLAEVLLPCIIADASRKAQQLADDSKAMLIALGDRAIKCITDMPAI